MSSSSDEGAPFQLRDYEEDSEDERPNKRRKTARALRGRGMNFVSSNKEGQDEDGEDEDDVDDERPTMGLGVGSGMGGFRQFFNIGEYAGQVEEEDDPPSSVNADVQERPVGGSGKSAFAPGGKIQKESFAARMMAKQGYVQGQGLGKAGQGITAPIQAQKLQSRAGLGVGSGTPEPRKGDRKTQDKSSKPSTSGTSTPRIKAPPKTKYTVAAIESRGLHVPEAMRSVIIDATGTENKTVASLSGFSTPTREASPALESNRVSARIKLQLQAYAEAWDAAKEQETRLEQEETKVQATVSLIDEEAQNYQALVSAFERVSADDSAQQRSWTDVVARLQDIQEQYADYIEEVDLSALASSCLESPFRTLMANWEPLAEVDVFLESIQSIGALLEIEKSTTSRHRKHTTPFESLLLQHWYPRIRTCLKDWSVYDPEPATTLLHTWQMVIPPWLTYKILSELIIPRLLEAVRRYPKTVESRTMSLSKSSTKRKAPDLHSWLFDWWSTLSSPSLSLELYPELRSLIKTKLTSSDWPIWKPLLGSSRPRPIAAPSPRVSAPPTPAAHIEEPPFREILEEWCSENDLILQSSSRSDYMGRKLLRLQDADMRKKGMLIYLAEDVVWDEEGTPYGLDEQLVQKATAK